jgi:hypothetical protein
MAKDKPKAGPPPAVVLSNRKNPTTYIASPDDLDGPAAARALHITRRTLRRWQAEKPPRLTYTIISRDRRGVARKVRFRRQVIEYYLAPQTIRGRYDVEMGS